MFYRFKSFEGPASYSWTDPDTGRQFSENSKQALIDRIVAYRLQNNLEPIEELSFVLESYWCGLPENHGRCEPVSELRRGFLGYMRAGIAFVKNLWYERTVSQEVADARARVCVKCPLNKIPGDIPAFEKWSNDIAVASVGARKTELHDELKVCAGCTCPLKAKVFYGDVIRLSEKERAFMREANPSCWQLPENLPVGQK